jgi:broad specificity phosphatase PhoE
MTKLVLIRHGEPDYSYVTERGFKGHGRDLGQLTASGIEQAKLAAKDSRLDGAELIVASPYTRALQTAAIISKERNLDISISLTAEYLRLTSMRTTNGADGLKIKILL